jgi:hypothetical protein
MVGNAVLLRIYSIRRSTWIAVILKITLTVCINQHQISGEYYGADDSSDSLTLFEIHFS